MKIPLNPPTEWFTDPGLTGPTRMTIGEDGRIHGHLALWDTCHVGIRGECVKPPTNLSRYGYFQLGAVKCDEGCEIPVGSITLGGGHADKHLTARMAAAHYDDVSTAVARVAVGNDDKGIWFSGALYPGVTPETVELLRGAKLSGDWRGVNGQLELIAVHAVNTPGFPIVTETAVAASGEVQTLIASIDNHDAVSELADRIGVDEWRIERLAARLIPS